MANVPGPDDGIEPGSGFSSCPFPFPSSFPPFSSVSPFSFAGEAVGSSFGASPVPPAPCDPG